MKSVLRDDVTILYAEQEDENLAEAYNSYIPQISTKYVAFCPFGLKNQYEELFSTTADLVHENRIVMSRFDQKCNRVENSSAIYQFVGVPFAVVLEKALILEIGIFNTEFYAGVVLELLCRILTKEERFYQYSVVHDSAINSKYEDGDEYASTVAYIFRTAIPYLKKWAVLEQVFKDICEKMQEHGSLELFQQQLDVLMTEEAFFEKIQYLGAPYVVLTGNDVCGGVLKQFAEQITHELRKNGQAVVEWGEQTVDGEWLEQNVFKGIIGFQAKALEMDFVKKLKGPKFQFWFDYPFHFQNVLRELPKDYFVLCQDQNYASIIHDYYHVVNAVHFFPGGIDLGTPEMKHREKDIVFIGSFFSLEHENFTDDEKLFVNYLCEHPNMTTEKAVSKLFFEHKEIDKKTFMEKCFEMKNGRRYVIALFREKIIATILSAGYEVHVYGDSWNSYEGLGKENLIIHPQISMEESLRELQSAKLGLNIMSWHKAGMTERVANIMLSGAVCLSDETSYLTQNMEPGTNIVLYNLEHLDQLPTVISDLLGDEKKRIQIANNAYELAHEKYTWQSRAEKIVELSKQYHDNKKVVKMFVATHVKFNPPSDPTYISLHVGREGKDDLGYRGDNTGANISDLNFLYGELTGLFWMWQNVFNCDYVGLCHYRRYFINEKRKLMTAEEYCDLLEKYDAIVPVHATCEGSYYQHFIRAHHQKDLDAVGKALKKLYPEYADSYDKAMQESTFYSGNIMLTSLEIMKAYAEWLFTIFMEAGEEIDVSDYDNYHKRVFGFLSEQMFYIFMLANGLTYCEVNVGISDEKAETKVLKTQLKALMEHGKKEEAKKILAENLKQRPDLLLPGSDLYCELKQIIQELEKN